MAFLELLTELLRIFTDLIPRFHPRPATNQTCVVDSFLIGVQHSRWTQRPILYLPLFTTVEHWDAHEEITGSCGEQTVCTQDRTALTVNVAFWYRIHDPIKTRRRWGNDYEEALTNIVSAAVAEWHLSCETADEAMTDCSEAIRDETCRDFNKGGCVLNRVRIEERATTVARRFFGVKQT